MPIEDNFIFNAVPHIQSNFFSNVRKQCRNFSLLSSKLQCVSFLGVLSKNVLSKLNKELNTACCINTFEPRSDRRDLLAMKVKSEIFTEKERPSCCDQLQ